MPKANYIAGNDDAFAAQLNLFTNNIGGYSAVLGLTPAQIAAQLADANYFNNVLQSQEAMQNGAQQWTSWKTGGLRLVASKYRRRTTQAVFF